MKILFSTLIFGVSMVVSSLTVYADPPVAPFYESVMKISPNGKLGQVIKREKVKTSVKGAQAWRIAYISSDLEDRKTISTGLLVAPVGQAPVEGRPVIAWAHGTTGTAQNCGPSQILDPVVPLNEYFLVGGNSWTDYGIPSIDKYIAEGYVVVATDYQGLGGGGKHQYNLPATNGRDLINSARAASSVKEVGAGKKVILQGWSQGGGALIAATSMGDYFTQKGTAADNLQLMGAVALAPYDLAALAPMPTNEVEGKKVMDSMVGVFTKNVFDFSHFTMTMWGLNAAHPELKLTDLYTDDGAKVIDEVINNKCMHVISDTFNFNYGDTYKTLLKDQRTNDLAWSTALLKGSVPSVKPITPVVIYWGTKDTVSLPIMHKLYQEQMCKLGGNIDRVQLPGEQTHFTTPGTAESFYLPWIKDRLAGKPATNNCAVAAQLPI